MTAPARPMVERERGAWLVRYELWMLRKSFTACAPDAPTLDRNPAVFATACCLIHARNVLDFLYPRKRLLPDDIVADEFTGGRWSQARPPSGELLLAGLPLQTMRRRLDTELAHLSYRRLVPREFDDQLWRYAALLAEDLLKLSNDFLALLEEPERSWFGAIPNGDREWLVESMLPTAG